MLILIVKIDLNTANDRASAKASMFHALILIVLGKIDCPYWLVVSKFHIVIFF